MEKQVKDNFLKNALQKLIIYSYLDGYVPDDKGNEKKRELYEILNSEEMMAIEPYLEQIMPLFTEATSIIKNSNIKTR